MSEQIVIDNLDFAKKSQEMHGIIPVSRLSRLQDVVASSDGDVDYSLTGFVNSLGKPGLRCIIKGCLSLTCQRCMAPMAWPLDIDSIVEIETGLPEVAEDELADSIEADPEMNVLSFIEDEVLLHLPLSPRHKAAECKPSEPAKDEKPNAFQALAALKTRKSEP